MFNLLEMSSSLTYNGINFMSAENRPNNIVDFEHQLPNDALPTGRFLSRLPGIDEEYGGFVGEGMVVWNGVSSLDNEQVLVRVAHIGGDTTFKIEGKDWSEVWEMEEEHCSTVTFSRKEAVIKSTRLNDSVKKAVKDNLWIKLNFCSEKPKLSSGRYKCSNCYINSPEQQERVRLASEEINKRNERNKKENILHRDERLYSHWIINKPSELPIRRASDINQALSSFSGFKNVQEGVDALLKIKSLIDSSSPLESNQSAPMPSSQELIIEDYFD